MDSGVLTLYNPEVLQHLGKFNAENFGEDIAEYVYPILDESVDSKSVDLSVDMCKSKFNKRQKCEYKKFRSGIGTPFTCDKFRIRATNEVFYVVNLHVRMNYPRIDSLKTTLGRIRERRKTDPIFRTMKWSDTVVAGDFNGDTDQSNEQVNAYFKSTRMTSVFKHMLPDRVFIGKHLILKDKKMLDVPTIKTQYEIQGQSDVEHNRQLVNARELYSDHFPYYVYFYNN